MSSSKFIMYNFSAKPVSHWVVEAEAINTSANASREAKVAHHIMIVDRSGSMYGDINPLKQMIEKMLTLDEYKQSSMLVTLISYASHGDCKVHFERTPVTKVMAANSPQLREIRSIYAGGCTGMSQAVRLAMRLVRDGELTGITLHSDGYANDPSPYTEQRSMEEICREIAKTSAFVNTVAYRQYSDFAFLSKVANDASGRCVLAEGVKEVYDSIYDTSAVLNRQAVPVMVVDTNGCDFVAFASETANRINGSTDKLKIAGLSKNDTGMIYRYRKVSEAAYNAVAAPVDQNGLSVYVFASALLASGSLNQAKYAMASTFDEELTRKHARALTGQQIAAMQADIQKRMYVKGTSVGHPIDLGGGVTVIDLLKVLDEYRDDIEINLKTLQKDYKRRGLKKVAGSRDENGKLVEPPVRTEVDDAEWVPFGTLDINRTQATVNMTIARPCKLIKVADGSHVGEVAGVKLDKLSDFKAYTIIGDGELNLSTLHLRVKSKTALQALDKLDFGRPVGALTLATGSIPTDVSVELSALPITGYDFNKDVSSISRVYDDVLEATTLQKILSAVAKEESDNLTKDQVEALRAVCVSKNGYINIPTTTEYTDLQAALNDGSVDIRTTYRVVVGNSKVLGASLPSANAFLDRWFEMVEKGTGKVADKATFASFLDRGISYKGKALSSRAKPAVTDGIMNPVFEDFIGTKANGTVNAIFKKAGLNETLSFILKDGAAGVIRAKKAVDEYIEGLYLENIIPLVFFVGCTGLLPDGLATKANTVDEIQAKYPDLKIGKDEREGTFFEIDKAILAVYPEKAYFSTGKPVSASASASTPKPAVAAKGKKKSAIASV